MCMTGNGNCWGAKALTARCSSTAESLPPEKSSTGRSHSATTSRRMKMAWDSSRSRWSVEVEVRKGVVVIVREVSVYPSKTLENVRLLRKMTLITPTDELLEELESVNESFERSEEHT